MENPAPAGHLTAAFKQLGQTGGDDRCQALALVCQVHDLPGRGGFTGNLG